MNKIKEFLLIKKGLFIIKGEVLYFSKHYFRTLIENTIAFIKKSGQKLLICEDFKKDNSLGEFICFKIKKDGLYARFVLNENGLKIAEQYLGLAPTIRVNSNKEVLDSVSFTNNSIFNKGKTNE
jgi:hypothetical protein